MLLVVVDTNVWISALLTPEGPPGRLVQGLGQGAFTTVLTPQILAELERVARRPRLVKRGITIDALDELVELLELESILLPEAPELSVCRDPRDDMFLSAAVTAEADFLVSRDDDLRRDPAVAELLAGRHTRVVSVRMFLEELGS